MPLSAKGKKSSQREPLVGERSRGTIRPERGTPCGYLLPSIVVGGGETRGQVITNDHDPARLSQSSIPYPGYPSGDAFDLYRYAEEICGARFLS